MGHTSFVCRFGLSILCAQLAAEAVYAQTADSTGELQEIVVTAQRREQSVLDVPLSLQAMSGEQLANSGIQDLTSLRFDTPGLTTASDSGFTQIFIRGIGNAIYIGADPSVAYFVDDVPRIYGTMADNLVDVERTEILKGAQGGLYGRNATGGVINVITRQPTTDEFSGDARIGYGEKNTFHASSSVNLPFNDMLALSLSGDRDSHDPYVTNTATRNRLTADMFPAASAFGNPAQTAAFFNAGMTAPKLNDQDFWSANGKLLFKPSENFKVTLAADWYNKQDDNGRGEDTENPALSQSLLAATYAAIGITTNFPPGLLLGPQGKFSSSIGVNSFLRIREYGDSATINWSLPGVDIVSISAYRRQDSQVAVDTGSLTIQTVPIVVDYEKHFFYQELRAISTFDGPFHLLGGATFLDNRLNGVTNVHLLSALLPLGVTSVSDEVKNWSAYAQAAYDINNRLTLTASGRYVHEDNDALFTQPVVSPSSSTEKKFIPSATLSYSLGRGTTYLRWARGFKTGGIDLATAPIFYAKPSDGSVFGPENVDTYEAGYRQALLNDKLQVTGAVFYNDYRDLQVGAHSTDPAIGTAVINAQSARTYGVEGSGTWQINRPLSLGVSAGYLNAKYKDFRLTDSTVLVPFDYSHEPMINSPKWQASFNGSLDQPINDRFRLVGTVLESYTSSLIYQYSALPGIVPNLAVPGYWITNARIGVRTTDDKYGIALVADNLFNRVYFVSGNSGVYGNNDTYGNPRIIRGELTVKF
jgi:iron complex outermembrane recepter protein